MDDLMSPSKAQAVPKPLNERDSAALTALRRRSGAAGAPDYPSFPWSDCASEAVTARPATRKTIDPRMCEIQG